VLNVSGSLLLGLDGDVVDSVQSMTAGPERSMLSAAPDWVGVCPQCRVRSSRSKGWVSIRARDIKVGPDRPRIVWRKRKWLCTNMFCKRNASPNRCPPYRPGRG
jgi:hypothetical protein